MLAPRVRRLINCLPRFDVEQKKIVLKALRELSNESDQISFFSIGKDFQAPAQNDVKYIYIPRDCTLLSVGIINTAPGTVVYDIWRSSSENYNPPTFPDMTASIVGSMSPSTVADVFYQDTILEGWHTSFNSGDVLGVHVDDVDGEFDSIIVLGLE